ncbi:MAG: sulfatase-like hydrolase/transferase [Lentisphaerae bacterium]|jgi:arylsulfatase A-like enzyme|nr:sulfatase-like hydrolase/transferase [Lentisphaerota bacterium]MBT4819883.1 sulfatase-like hydrolase/transferase [Lentisphaerota bacterium]MBT5605083.1 sulfatase-like hydrolase/transferase [Lentisphaerota bacterium]MBT7062232.1 sulfatase-like hydrolase/transferase [Lentisphaerota bacterium]MBT7847046.1 sulfatase-like hydrolase/transferase [Lentisphaerota bacterium]
MPRDGRPNILLIMTDQHRYDTMGGHGHTRCRTPRLDRLAADGIDFSRAYTCCGLCSPARASIMTGLYPHRHGLQTNTHDFLTQTELDPDIPTFAHRLSDAGYHMSYAGKVHLTFPERTPCEYGFDEWHVPYGEWLSTNGKQRARTVAPEFGPANTSFQGPFAAKYDGPLETHNDYWRIAEGMRMLEERAEALERDGTPFFLRVDLFGPHLPFHIPEPFFSMYDPASVPCPPEFDDSFRNKPWIHRQMVRYWQTEETDWAFWQPIVALYWAYVTMLDHCIGVLLDKLSELDLDETTAVFYSTDHGDTCGSRRMFDKGYCMYEELYHIPLIARWKGVWEAGRRTEAFANNIDLMATFLDLAGVPVPQEVDSRSLLPLLENESTPADWPTDAFAEFHGMQWGLYSQRMLVTERHKLVMNAADTDELYDLVRDPAELVNVLDDPEYAQPQADLYRRMFHRMEQTHDPLACDNWWPKFEDARQALGEYGEATYGTKAWPDPVRRPPPPT